MGDATETERRIAAILVALPEMCATMLPSSHEAIVIKRGESRHWPPPDGMTIERINQVFHASPPQIAAMLVGSMFGWELPGADPARYDATGRPRRC